MDVYCDVVFNPLLTEKTFEQEGWHYHQESLDAPLQFQGVVYNEMKGAMSSPDQVMVRSMMNALYPDTTYQYNSGGDPSDIPALTYEQLKAFHRRHYHPSNAFFYTYGNMPVRDHLAFITEKVLGSFERIDPKTGVAPQPRWTRPKKVVYPYPLSKSEDAAKKYQACVAWLTADIRDNFEVLVLTLLGQVLLGNDASPLRKALIDSNLGTALSDGSGFDSDNLDTLFACGLKDVRESDAEKIEAIIFEVLQGLVADGIDPELIEAAIHQIEFHRKEVTNTPYPHGIKLLMAFAGSWMHGGDPERVLKFDADLEKLRRELARGAFLEGKLKTWFLDNPHRVLFTLKPDQELADRQARQEAAELEALYASMSSEALEAVKKDAEALMKLQEAQENVSCLPTLELEDIPPSVKRVVPSLSDQSQVHYSRPTSGIFYFTAAAGIAALDASQIPLLPFFCHAVSRVGTQVHDYLEMARRIDAYTGGIGFGAHARIGFDGSGACIPFVSFNGKCLARNQEKMFEIIEELVTRFDFSDQVCLKNLLLEYRAALESMIIHNGHRLAMSLASRNFSVAGTLSETWHGIHQLQFIKRLTDDLTAEKLKTISEDLAGIGRKIFIPDNLKMALIGEERAVAHGSRLIAKSRNLRDLGCPLSASDGFKAPEVSTEPVSLREGWCTSSSVSFVASAFETVRMDHDDAPALTAVSKLLRSLYLHREIREKGGAYGGFAVYNPETGLFCFGSYRDPHIISTLNVYDRAADYIKSGAYENEDVKEAVLQVCSEIDKPDPPGPAARKAFYRQILSLSDEARERFKSELLTLNRDRVAAVAEKYFTPGRIQAVAVISGEQQLKSANEKLAGNPLKLYAV